MTLERHEYNGITMWVREGDDRAVMQEVHSYTLPDYPVQTIIDAGAHIGAATAYFKQRWPDAQVVAIEPEQGNYDMLFRNVSYGALAIRARLAYTDDDVVLAVHPEHTTCHRIVTRNAVTDGLGVDTDTSSI